MSGVLQAQLEAMATTAKFLAGQADDLGTELADIARTWSDLSPNWIGKAGSAYEPAWDEWHQDAKAVTAILEQHADLLVQSVSMLVEHENQAASALGSLGQNGTRG